ncbi:uncharacterized protein cd8b [Cottoperca gobio]|uniref:Uncharacterized protein cd8b n=1 Tax=Cottoperca gobio TaxID=56716 RepID=A0A6J2PRN4_COTGO|nr:uncharacterized protein LOC115008489 [Cottoperca gobio]
MIVLPLAWTLLTASLWTSGSSQILLQEPVNTLYPEILSTQSIECDCANGDSVYWFRSISNHNKIQFLGQCNQANRVSYGKDVNQTRFIFRSKSTTSFVLHIMSVTEEDAGTYSCVLSGKKNTETWKPGILLRPGETPPTLPPKTKPPVKSVCHCKISSQDGCGSLVLWPLVGLIAALALALICTLYYFSRLPKKCRHRFVKKR